MRNTSKKSCAVVAHKSLIFLSAIISMLSLSATIARADLEWSGMYRVEGDAIGNPQLDNRVAKDKNYGVQTLILRPKFVAADGIYIYSQFNILNSGVGGNNLGAVFGDGVGANNGVPGTGIGNSSAISEYQRSEVFSVTELYMKMEQEFGDLIVGRVPLNFGLGMSYSDGSGLFDHYVDTRDAVAYKVNIGNLFIMPMFAKVYGGDLGNIYNNPVNSDLSGADGIEEWDLQAEYDDPDSNTSIGLFYQNRMASPAGNDTPEYPVSISAQPNTVQPDRMDIKNVNVFYKKKSKNYSAGFEAGLQSGNFGVDNVDGNNVKLGGFGAVVEYSYTPQTSKWGFGVKAGLATGGDPRTDTQYEGFIFNQNYDVALLLFNQPLGQADLLHTSLIGRRDAVGNSGSGPSSDPSVDDDPDTEAISNVYYLSPSITRIFSDRWSGTATLTGAWLDNSTVTEGNPTTNSLSYYNTSSDLGYELDITANYQVSKSIMWQNEVGVLLPGQAWTVGGQFKADMSYGLLSRAAVSF